MWPDTCELPCSEELALGLQVRLQVNDWERKGCIFLLLSCMQREIEFCLDMTPAEALCCIPWYGEHLDGATLICFLEACEALIC